MFIVNIRNQSNVHGKKCKTFIKLCAIFILKIIFIIQIFCVQGKKNFFLPIILRVNDCAVYLSLWNFAVFQGRKKNILSFIRFLIIIKLALLIFTVLYM